MVRGLIFNPQVWVEETSDARGAAAPPPPARESETARRGATPAKATMRSAPTARPTTSNLDWPVLLATITAELSTDCADPSCFPKSVIRIHSAFNEPGKSLEDLLKLIQAEPRLGELLVVLANAALFGAGAKRVTDLRDAVSLLGKPIIRGAAVAFAIQRMRAELSLRSIAAPLMELWRTSLGVACISQVVARRSKVKPEDAFFTGLLHGIGYLYVMTRSIGKSSALGTDLLGHDLIGKTHPSIGKAALGRWGASDEMAQAVNDQLRHERSVRSLDKADLTDILIVSIALVPRSENHNQGRS